MRVWQFRVRRTGEAEETNVGRGDSEDEPLLLLLVLAGGPVALAVLAPAGGAPGIAPGLHARFVRRQKLTSFICKYPKRKTKQIESKFAARSRLQIGTFECVQLERNSIKQENG